MSKAVVTNPLRKIKGKDIRKIGFPSNKIIGMAIDAIHRHFKHEKKENVLTRQKPEC